MVTIESKMKDGNIKKYHWQDDHFAWVCFQWIIELQKDLESKRVKSITVYDNATKEIYMKNGLKSCQWPRNNWRKEPGNYKTEYITN